MSVAITPKRYTPDDLLRIPDGSRFELVNGQLVELNVSTWSSYVAGEVHARLREYCRANGKGWVFPEGTSYQCFPDAPDKVRKPDTSCVLAHRMSADQARAEGHISLSPDLAVEVLSPNDLAYDVNEKMLEYIGAGVRLVWIIDPHARIVNIHRMDGKGDVLRETDDLDGEDVLPGFRCRVAELFLPPPGVAGTA